MTSAWTPIKCVLCGETVSDQHFENGLAAEMYDPDAKPGSRDHEGGVCHAQCGISASWEVA